MRTPTHIAYSTIFLSLFGTIIQKPTPLWQFVYGALISLIPDIDSPYSVIGKLFPRTSRLVERKFGGHRAFTHTLNALFFFALFTSPIIFFDILTYSVGIVAYFSHLFADCMTKSGNPIVWKSNYHAVFPKSAKLRITVGKKAEKNLCICLFLLSIPLFLLNQNGLLPFLHSTFGDISSSITEYLVHENRFRCFAQLKGRWVVSQEPIDTTLEVIGQINENTLAVFEPKQDIVYAVGSNRSTANIIPSSIKCFPKEPIEVSTQYIDLNHQLLGIVLNLVPIEGESFISGNVTTPDQLLVGKPSESYQTIKKHDDNLELIFARPREIRKREVATIFVTSGRVVIRTIYPKLTTESGSVKPTGFSIQSRDKEIPQEELSSSLPTDLYITQIGGLQDVYVKEDQVISKGQIIAKRSMLESEMKLKELEILLKIANMQTQNFDTSDVKIAETKVLSAQNELKSQQDVLRAYEQLFNVGLISKASLQMEEDKVQQKEIQLQQAHGRFQKANSAGEEKLRKHQEGLSQLQFELERLKQRKEEIFVRMPIRARVIYIQPHVIHDSNFTVRIRLLTLSDKPKTQPSEPPSKPKKPEAPLEKPSSPMQIVKGIIPSRISHFLGL